MTDYEQKQLWHAVSSIHAVVKRGIEAGLITKDDLDELKSQLESYVDYLSGVQGHKQQIRLVYYEAAFHVYNFLRNTRQLERRVVGMRQTLVDAIKDEIYLMRFQ